MADYYFVQNDTYPPISGVLADENHVPVDLTECSVQFHMRNKETDELVVDSAALVDVPSSGEVVYAWKNGDLGVPGQYTAEFEVTYSDGGVETFPTTVLEIYVRPEVN
jgi:Rib/alpha/Esp surface antigen-like repeat protein